MLYFESLSIAHEIFTSCPDSFYVYCFTITKGGVARFFNVHLDSARKKIRRWSLKVK